MAVAVDSGFSRRRLVKVLQHNENTYDVVSLSIADAPWLVAGPHGPTRDTYVIISIVSSSRFSPGLVLVDMSEAGLVSAPSEDTNATNQVKAGSPNDFLKSTSV